MTFANLFSKESKLLCRYYGSYYPIEHSIQNDYNNTFNCHAMLLTDLANPKWISVDCDEPVTSNILCYFEVEQDIRKQLSVPSRHIYDKICIAKNNTCYKFLWHKNQFINREKYHIHIRTFQYVFDAVETTFPPIFSGDFKYAFSYQRLGHIYIYRKRKRKISDAGGLYIHQEKYYNFIKGGNVFECGNGRLISVYFLCDGINDCGNINSTDEVGCYCGKANYYSNKCKYIYKESIHRLKQHISCSYYYIESKTNNCRKYLLDLQSCQNNSGNNILKTEKVNNIHVTYIPNEYNTFQLDTRQLPCSNDQLLIHSFHIFDICTFRRDAKNNLIPCPFGEHLQNCKDFECNMKYKCPKYYCIPWSYVCDGKWDCPRGSDENYCSQSRNCTNMYKCRNSIICIHLGNICDQVPDCPLEDDEYVCFLHEKACPVFCECLGFAISCKNLTTWSGNKNNDLLPYHIIHIEHGDKIAISHFLKTTQTVTIIKMTRNNLDMICNIFPFTNNTLFIDASYNEVRTLQKYCFDGLYYLKILMLNNNKISLINFLFFVNLINLKLLDLSNNKISIVNTDCNIRDVKLHLLNLQNISVKVSFSKPLISVNIKFLKVNYYDVCCALSDETYCIAEKAWYTSCSDLLSNRIIKLCFYSISVVIIICSGTSLAIQVLQLLKNKKTKTAFILTVASINILDVTYAVYLTVLSIVDYLYKERFGLYQSWWKSSFMCYFSSTIVQNYCILSRCLICLLALERLMVVLYPFNTKFKETKYVLKYIFFLWINCLTFNIFITVRKQVISEELTNNICFSFIDPSSLTPLTKMIVYFIIILQSIATLFTPLCYLTLIYELLKSQGNVLFNTFNVQSKTLLFVHLVVIVLSSMLSWIASSAIYLAAMFGDKYPIDMISWTVVVVIPVNSIVNSIVFLATSIESDFSSGMKSKDKSRIQLYARK